MSIKQLKIIQGFLGVLLIATLTFFVLDLSSPKAEPILQPVAQNNSDSKQKSKVHYVAIGDSLTEGIGDETKRGGFVPLVASDLTDRYHLSSIEVENYGVAGERSDQILKRIEKEKKIQDNLKSADFITLTVGGNDLMKVIQDNFFGLSIKSFAKPQAKYQKRVTTILSKMRKLNPTAPIYVLGIYNPFYLNFPEITDMQTIVDDWNGATKDAVTAQKNCYFIPINDLLYQGIGNQAGVESTLDSSEEAGLKSTDGNDLGVVDNNVLYQGDKFHPNTIGYQLMANAVRDELVQTQQKWLPKEDSDE